MSTLFLMSKILKQSVHQQDKKKKDMVYSYNEILYRQNDVQVMTTSFKNK